MDSPGSDQVCTNTRLATLTSPAQSPSSTQAARVAADTFVGYELLAELNRGGQGVVFKARQKATNRDVALKVPLAGALLSDEARKRFDREIQLVARLRHPNVVTIFHADVTADGRPFFVMDYVEGRPLGQFVREAGSDTRRILTLFAEICDGVESAHEAGIIHRDLKPGNILIDSEGRPRILDFGLGKLLEEPADLMISQSHQMMGTLPYMAPEQVRGDHQHVDARTDVYSLGVMLYEALTGRFPYPIDAPPHEVVGHILSSDPVRPSSISAGVKYEIETIMLKCLAKEPARRYQSARELGEDLRRLLAGEAIHAKRDSLRYVVRKRSEKFVRRHPIVAYAGVFVVATLAARYVADPLVIRWTPINRWFEGFVAAHQAPPPGMTRLDRVCVVGLTDQTDVAALARSEGLEDVDPKHWRSVRRLHGRLMEKLALYRPRVVVWDLKFLGESPFDEDFVKGVSDLKQKGIETVCAVPHWWAREKRPDISPAIGPKVRWGTIHALFDSAPPQLQLVMQADQKDPLPSLALAAVAAARHPDCEVAYAINPDPPTVRLMYYKTDPGLPQHRLWLNDSDQLRLTILHEVADKTETMAKLLGVRVGDQVGIHLFQLLPGEILAASTIDYADVIAAGPSLPLPQIENKIIVLADMRKGADEHRCADGRTIAGGYANALAIEELLNEAEAAAPRHAPWISSVAADEAVFALLGIATALIPWRVCRLSALAGIIVLAAVGGLIIAPRFRYLWNPTAPIVALALSFAVTKVINYVRVFNSIQLTRWALT